MLLFQEPLMEPSTYNSILKNTNWGIFLAFLLLLIYIVKASTSNRSTPELANGAIVFIAAYGIYAGCQLMMLASDGSINECINGRGVIQIHVLIGGIAVVWASFISIRRILFPPRSRRR